MPPVTCASVRGWVNCSHAMKPAYTTAAARPPARTMESRTGRSYPLRPASPTGAVARRQPDDREVRGDELAVPPPAAGAALVGRREPVQIELCADPPRRPIRKWIGLEETENAAVSLEQLQQQLREPRIVLRRRHRGEPHQPVDAEVIGCDLPRTPRRIPRLAPELILAPHRRIAHRLIAGAFDRNLVPLPSDAAERAVGVDDLQRVERRVHHLPRRE